MIDPTTSFQTVEARLASLEARRNKDDSSKRVDGRHKWLTFSVSVLAILIALANGVVSGVFSKINLLPSIKVTGSPGIGVVNFKMSDFTRRFSPVEPKNKSVIETMVRIDRKNNLLGPVSADVDLSLGQPEIAMYLKCTIASCGAPVTITAIKWDPTYTQEDSETAALAVAVQSPLSMFKKNHTSYEMYFPEEIISNTVMLPARLERGEILTVYFRVVTRYSQAKVEVGMSDGSTVSVGCDPFPAPLP